MGFLTNIFRAATPENPRFSLNDPGAWEAFYAGAPSSAGVAVNRKTALTLPAFWRAVNLVSNSVAKTPLPIYRRVDNGRELYPEHAGYRLLMYEPNPYTTAFQWKRTMMLHALMRGNGYSYIDRLGDGTPFALLGLDPETTCPVRERGQLWYVVKVNGEQRKIPGEDVLHWAGPGWDGLVGYDVLTVAREAIGEGLAKQRYTATFFGNNARPGVVIEVPVKMKTEGKQELLRGFDRMHKGLENAHKTAILDGGAKLNPLTINAKDADLIESRKLSLIDVANIIGVPPHKVGSDGTTGYASLEQEDQSYLDEGLDPWLCMIEQDGRKKLLTEEEKQADSAMLEFDRKTLIRSDSAARASYLRTALGGRPWMVPDEAREREGLNPLGGEAGEYLNPLNMGKGGMNNEPDDKGGPQPGNPTNNNALRAALFGSVEDASRRVVKRIGLHARRTAADPKKFLVWVDCFEHEHHAVALEMLTPALAAALAFRGEADRGPEAPTVRLLAILHRGLFAIPDQAIAAKLVGEVDRWMTDMEATLPVAFAREILGEEDGQLQRV